MDYRLPSDSPWRRLPSHLSRRQVMFFDGLRLSAQMAAISLSLLEGLLRDLMERIDDSEIGDSAATALIHSYGVVDAVHRFRELFRVFPGLKQRELFTLFMNRTESVEEARNHIQHLNQELDAVGKCGAAALGILRWLAPGLKELDPPAAWILVPGSFYPGQITVGPMIDLAISLRKGAIADLSLVVGPHEAPLQELVRQLFGALNGLEPSLRSVGKDNQQLGADVLMQMALIPVEPRAADQPRLDEGDATAAG